MKTYTLFICKGNEETIYIYENKDIISYMDEIVGALTFY